MSDKRSELLFSVTAKDLIIETYRGSGKGGQNRNKVETCVRITHPESGAVGQACEQRMQGQNKKKAFERLVESKEFKTWHKRKTSAMLAGYQDAQHRAEIETDKAMHPKNLRIEVRTENGWELEKF